MKPITFCFFLATIFLSYPFWTYGSNTVLEIKNDWNYQWEGKGKTWLPLENYKEIPTNVPLPNLWLSGRQKEYHLLMKTTLPHGDWEEPTLFLSGVFGSFVVFVDREKKYERNGEGVEIYYPYSHHLIPLEKESSQTPLIISIFSNYVQLGIKGDVWIGSREDIIKKLIKKEIDRLLLILFFFICTLLSFWEYVKTKDLGMFYVFVFSLSGTFLNISFIQTKQLWFNFPNFWGYLQFFCIYLVAFSFYLFVQNLLKSYFLQWIGKSLVIFGLCCIFILFTSFVPLFFAKIPFYLFLATCSLLIIAKIVTDAFNREKETKGLEVGIVFFLFVVIYDLANQLGAFPWQLPLGHWGHLVLSFFFVYFQIKLRSQSKE